MESIVVITYRH